MGEFRRLGEILRRRHGVCGGVVRGFITVVDGREVKMRLLQSLGGGGSRSDIVNATGLIKRWE